MTLQFTKANMPNESQRWAREIEQALKTIDQGLSKALNQGANAASASNGKQLRIQDQVQEIQATVDATAQTVASLQTVTANLQDVTAKLTAAGQVQTASLGKTVSGFSGFYTGSRPTVNISSPTGRIEVLFGGSLNGGNGIFVINVVNTATGTSYKSRTSMRANYDERLAVSGGASFIGSAFSSVIVAVPVNTQVTVTLELYSDSGEFVYFFGGKIQVSASL